MSSLLAGFVLLLGTRLTLGLPLEIQVITEPLVVGESPHWDVQQQALFFVSVTENTINKYVLSTGVHTRTKLDGRVGFIVPVEGTTDQFVVGLERRFSVVQWDGQDGTPATEVREIAEIDKDMPKNRLNDGKADPKGRLFSGTMGHDDPPGNFSYGEGSMFRLDGTNVTKLEDEIGLSNGLAWDLEENAFYYIDSLEQKVRRYDYDVNTGEIWNKQYIFDLEEHNIEGIPDGCTIDTDGNLWVAVYNGYCVLKINPRTGELLQKLEMPAKIVTSATFGGPNLDILFVTSANENIDGHLPTPHGSTFMVTGLGVTGKPSYNYKL